MSAVLRILGAIIGTAMVLLSPFLLLVESGARGVWGALGAAITGATLAYYGFTGRSRYDQSISDAVAGHKRRPRWDD